MGDLFGGDDQKAVVYGELPGMKEGAQTYLDQILGLLKQGTPAESWIGQQAEADQGLANTGRQRESEMLQPGWAEQTSPGLDDLFGAWRRQNAEDKAANDRALLMRFGGAGQSFSSPMLDALAKARTQADRGLETRIDNTQYQDYARKQNLMSSLLPGLSSRATSEAALSNQLTYDKLAALLRYVMAAKGKMAAAGDGGGGLLEGLLGPVGGALGTYLGTKWF